MAPQEVAEWKVTPAKRCGHIVSVFQLYIVLAALIRDRLPMDG